MSGKLAEWSNAIVLKTIDVKSIREFKSLTFLQVTNMTRTEAEDIKIKIEELNIRYAPIKLNFDMYRNDKYDSSEDNWFVTIVYNYTPEEWMEFVTIGFNYNQVKDKLFGFGFGLESVKMYQEEYGNLKFLAQ